MTFTYTQTAGTPFGQMQDSGKVFTGSAAIPVDEEILSDGFDPTTMDVVVKESALQVMALLSSVPCEATTNPVTVTYTLAANVMTLVTAAGDDLTQIIAGPNLVESGPAGTIKVRVLYDATLV